MKYFISYVYSNAGTLDFGDLVLPFPLPEGIKDEATIRHIKDVIRDGYPKNMGSVTILSIVKLDEQEPQ